VFNRIKESFGAWRRGEKRIAPHGSRGRVFVKKNPEAESSAGSEKRISAGPKAVLEITVTRADGTVEKHAVPATAEFIK